MQTSLCGIEKVLQPKAVRVHRTAIVAQLEMQVGTGRIACGAHVTDDAPSINC